MSEVILLLTAIEQGNAKSTDELLQFHRSTDTGRPFFVMELVRGIKITDHCDQKTLSTPERLDLFIQVCQAVQHAHQKGIIHRDIKPLTLERKDRR